MYNIVLYYKFAIDQKSYLWWSPAAMPTVLELGNVLHIHPALEYCIEILPVV